MSTGNCDPRCQEGVAVFLGGSSWVAAESEKGGAMPSRTDVMVWGMVVVLMCMIAIDIVRTQV